MASRRSRNPAKTGRVSSIFSAGVNGAIVMKPSSVRFGHERARSTAAGTSSGRIPSFDRSPLMLTSSKMLGRAPISSAIVWMRSIREMESTEWNVEKSPSAGRTLFF